MTDGGGGGTAVRCQDGTWGGKRCKGTYSAVLTSAAWVICAAAAAAGLIDAGVEHLWSRWGDEDG